MNYTNFKFYAMEYIGNKIPQDDFEVISRRASVIIRKHIFNRDITGYEREVQMATCSVAEILYKIEKLEQQKNSTISDKTLKSESVGDYSRTFEISSISDIEKQISNQNEKIKEEIRMYLLHTGLLYRGV